MKQPVVRRLRHGLVIAFGLVGLSGRLPVRAQAGRDWAPGDKVAVGPVNHPATVLKADAAKTWYFVHYEDNAYPDSWEREFLVHARGAGAKSPAATSGPRLGKYLIYGYGANPNGDYNGYFVLRPGNAYEVFRPGGQSDGSGRYAFNSGTATVTWYSGPFADKAWNGTQHFEVEREGKTHIIRLMARTIGTNSTDSQQ